MKQIIGVLLGAAPIVGAFIAYGLTMGWLPTLIIFGLACAAMALIALGAHMMSR